jgi:hypothetical protein
MMPTLQHWLVDRRSRSYKHAVLANLQGYENDLNALSDKFRQDLLTEKEYDKRIKVLDKRHEERENALRAIIESEPRITDILAIRIALEALAWSALFVLAGFLIHPIWSDNNLLETLGIACTAGIASSYLRNTWKRSAL